MKRIGYLYQKIISKENIQRAMIDACKTKKNHRQVTKVLNQKEKAVEYLQNNFHISGNYIEKKHIDISSGKERNLIIPPYYPDQVIQHALVQVTEPYIKKKIYYECCCSIKNRGTLYASNLVRKALKHEKVHYYVKFDVRKYFPSVDHAILMSMLERIFKDKQVLDLYHEIIYSVKYGIPIGNYTSQSLANLYLTPLDRYIKQELHIDYYVRYMDDFIIIGSNKRKLSKSINLIKTFLKTNLNLITHDNEKVQSVYDTPIDFCGYRHYKDYVTIRKRVWVKTRRMMLRQQSHCNINRSKRLMSYLGYIYHSNSDNILNRYSNIIKRSKEQLSIKEEING